GIAAETIRREMLAAEPAAHFVEVHGLQERLEPQIRPWSLGATMFSVFGMLALVTASLGLYSVIAYSVTQRTHEFGVRAALGASESRVIGAVIGEGMRTTALGLAAGGVIALVAAPRIESLL